MSKQFYNIKIEKTVENERMVDFLKAELFLGNNTAVFMHCVAKVYQGMTKYRSGKYIKERFNKMDGSIKKKDTQIALCLAMPNGVVDGDMCQYTITDEISGKEHLGTRPLVELTQSFVDDNTNNENN